MRIVGMRGVGLILVAIAMTTVLASSASPVLGDRLPQERTSTRQVQTGPVVSPRVRSRPLVVPPGIPPVSAERMATVAPNCPSRTIDLRILVLDADGTDPALTAIGQVLDYLGTPYTVLSAAPVPSDPSIDRLVAELASGCHGFYQGVILSTGELAYFDGSTWVSALTPTEWQTLWSYEASFGIRQLSWYTFPTAAYGFQPPTFSGVTPISAQHTPMGRTVFSYANGDNPLTIRDAWAYLARPLDANTIPLLIDGAGNALGAVRTYPDGRQNLALTFDSNPYLLHTLVLSFGLVNWVTKGLFLGERHVYLSTQVDDLLIDSNIWPPGTPCGTDPETTGVTYRLTGADLQAVVSWQQAKQAQPTTRDFRLDLAYNGVGVTGIYNPDTLTPAVRQHQGRFKWISHTYDHEDLDSVNEIVSRFELEENDQIARPPNMGFTTYNRQPLVTPGISGLENPLFLRVARDFGVRFVVSDTSRGPGHDSPSPNAGNYNALQPEILMIPRRPSNLFYNVSDPSQWVAEFNCIYRGFFGRDLTHTQIVDFESQVLLTYLLTGDIAPLMFHQANLRAYAPNTTLLTHLLDATLARYNALFVLPIVSPTMDDLGRRMARRMEYNASGASASIVPGQSVTLTVDRAATVPVTGLRTPQAEQYGGQFISYIQLGAGQTVTLPLS